MPFRFLTLLGLCAALFTSARAAERPRARDLGIVVGALPPGPLNAITDVPGVRVGQVTLIRGDSVRTGLTVILPHAGNLYESRVPAAISVGNGYGKLIGYTQIAELGELETPIALTNTLAVWRVADALAQWMLHRPGMERVGSINPVVAETNDGSLNAILTVALTQQDLLAALAAASEGPVAEGSVGAGTGTVAFQWKGGIGTSSRELAQGRWRLGVLVQSNFGRWQDLRIEGAPVGRELGRSGIHPNANKNGDGSIVVVIATDAPLSDRNLKRLASRALLGIGRSGGFASNGSGDYVIAFSTHPGVRRTTARDTLRAAELGNAEMNPLFEAAVDATVEAIYNSLLRATSQAGAEVSVEALPIEELRAILSRYGIGKTSGKDK